MSRWLARLALIGALLVTGASFLLTLVVWLGVSIGRLPPALAVGAAQINLSSVLDAFTALAITVVAALIVLNRPGNRLGWVILLLGFSLGLSGFSRAYAGMGVARPDGVLPGLMLAAWVSQVIWFMIFLALELLLLLFPTGTLLSPRWRWVAAAALLITACALALLAVGTPIEVPGGQVANPIGLIPFERVERYLFALFIPFLITLVLALLSLALRFHRAAGVERQQIKWLLYVAALFLTAQLAISFGAIGEQFTSLVALGFPIAIGIAVLRYRLFDIDVIIRKTLVYTALTALLALVYFGSVVLLQRLFGAVTGMGNRRWRWSSRRWSSLRSSRRCAAASKTSSIGASSARSTTRSGSWPSSPSPRATRPTWSADRRSWRTWCRRRCSRKCERVAETNREGELRRRPRRASLSAARICGETFRGRRSADSIRNRGGFAPDRPRA